MRSERPVAAADEQPSAARIPKHVWLYWHQGFEGAPWIVQRCAESWRQQNPGWQVHQLDAISIREVLGEDQHVESWQLGLAHQSDLIRLRLLQRYGGVWTDATTLCRTPLDSWLPQSSGSGFFAFERPGRDRLIANWFLACSPNNPIAARLHDRLCRYWSETSLRSNDVQAQRLQRLLSALLNRSSWTARIWLSPAMQRGLNITPYFVFHYLFADLISNDAGCRAIWKATARRSARPPLLIDRIGLITRLTPELEQTIEQCAAPVFKLTWKVDPAGNGPETVLQFLLGDAAPSLSLNQPGSVTPKAIEKPH